MKEPNLTSLSKNANQTPKPRTRANSRSVVTSEGPADLDIELTVLMPCLNEAKTLGKCIEKAKAFIKSNGIVGEIVIADNGSTDGSQQIARDAGARVVSVVTRGYGAALMEGIQSARGTYVIMGDSDNTYDFSNLGEYVAELRAGNDLVMGNRFRGGIAPGAMPILHRYLGNPVLSAIGRLFFKAEVGDFHCGLRGFNKNAIDRLDLQTTGMEFASEMIVKAILQRLSIAEVPTTLSVDHRGREPHLRTWRDGWRHLRFLLMYAPRWLFLYPGLGLMAMGIAAMAAILPGPLQIGAIIFDVHTLIVAMGAIVVGSQVSLMFVLAEQYGVVQGLLPETRSSRLLRSTISLERSVAVGAFLFVGGFLGLLWGIYIWSGKSFGQLDYSWVMRIVVPSVTSMCLGTNLAFAGFFSSILELKAK